MFSTSIRIAIGNVMFPSLSYMFCTDEVKINILCSRVLDRVLHVENMWMMDQETLHFLYVWKYRKFHFCQVKYENNYFG